jgi:hypothetical protein
MVQFIALELINVALEPLLIVVIGHSLGRRVLGQFDEAYVEVAS